jgi:hypothetical protein
VCTVVNVYDPSMRQQVRSSVACTRLLDRFMVDTAELRPMTGEPALDGSHDDRRIVEALASTLWSVFSHGRCVIDRTSRYLHMGSPRSAAELIADMANARYPSLEPPIRYADCYLLTLAGEDGGTANQQLYRWVFRGLQAQGCNWVFSTRPGPAVAERYDRLRQISEVLSRAYEENAGLYAPLPGIIAAYREVYGKLPEGWPA